MAASKEPRVPKPKNQGSNTTAYKQPVATSGKPAFRPKAGGAPKSTMKNNPRATKPTRGTGKGAH